MDTTEPSPTQPPARRDYRRSARAGSKTSRAASEGRTAPVEALHGRRSDMTKTGRRKRRREFLVFSRDGFRCVYCGKSPVEGDVDVNGKPVKLEADHIVARSEGGTDTVGNFVTACRGCNRSKFTEVLASEDIERLQVMVRARNAARGIRDDTVLDVGRMLT